MRYDILSEFKNSQKILYLKPGDIKNSKFYDAFQKENVPFVM